MLRRVSPSSPPHDPAPAGLLTVSHEHKPEYHGGREHPEPRQGQHRCARRVLPGRARSHFQRDSAAAAADPRGSADQLHAGRHALGRGDAELRVRADPGGLSLRPLRTQAAVLHRAARLVGAVAVLRTDPRVLARAGHAAHRRRLPRAAVRAGSRAAGLMVSAGAPRHRHELLHARRFRRHHRAVARRPAAHSPLRLARRIRLFCRAGHSHGIRLQGAREGKAAQAAAADPRADRRVPALPLSDHVGLQRAAVRALLGGHGIQFLAAVAAGGRSRALGADRRPGGGDERGIHGTVEHGRRLRVRPPAGTRRS